ncbi:MAG: DNA (cytosine-5-)-methyltransferase [Brevinema sp.]
MSLETLTKPINKQKNSTKKTTKTYTFIDLCAGIGGGRLGLEQQGFKCLNFSEIDSKAIQSYQLLHNDKHKGLGNLCEISSDDILDVDLIIAGFPCQSYSIVGQRKGLEDHRGQVIYGISKILQNKKVPYFILENVKGLISINKGEDFQTILTLLDESGYNVYYKVLNSLEFGVPHSRERIYFVGVRKDLDTKNFIFPLGTKQDYDLALYLDKSDKIDKSSSQYQTFLKYLNNKYNIGRFNLTELLKQDYLVLDTRQSDLRLYCGYIPTIRKGRQGILYIYQNELYSLSKNDALRMQGYTDTYITRLQHISKSTVLEQVGNAMTINVIEAIAKKLKHYIHR